MDLHLIAKRALLDYMDVKNTETVLIVSDGQIPEVVGAFLSAARELAKEAILVEFTPRSRNGEEPPFAVAAAMAAADVVLIPTSKSLTHTRARREANRSGTRIASMPMITAEMMNRTLMVDYVSMVTLTKKYANALSKGNTVHITSPAGTDLVMKIEGRDGIVDSGEIQQSGASGNLPAGEACIAPQEGSAQGILVFDGSLAQWGKLDEPITITVKAGLATSISGNKAADWLWETVQACGVAGTNIAELGIGTNARAVVSGNILEDEKAIGTVHVALGDNKGLGGMTEAGVHLDGLILSPTVAIDGKTVIKDGILLLLRR